MRNKTTADNIERISAFILLLGSALSFLFMKDFRHLYSFAVGSAIIILNFRVLRKILEGGLLKKTPEKKAIFIVLPVKFAALVLAIVLVLMYGNLNTVFFLMGLSTIFASIVVTQIGLLMGPLFGRRQRDGA